MELLHRFLLALQLAGGAALLAGPPLERRALRNSRAAVVCGLFDAMGGEIAKDPFGMLKNNLQQMSDQRVAQDYII